MSTYEAHIFNLHRYQASSKIARRAL